MYYFLPAEKCVLGFGSDFNQFGLASFANTNNIGGFLRHEFK
jgi:hypothetical protein